MNEREARMEEGEGGECGQREERLRVRRRGQGPTRLSIKCTWVPWKGRE